MDHFSANCCVLYNTSLWATLTFILKKSMLSCTEFWNQEYFWLRSFCFTFEQRYEMEYSFSQPNDTTIILLGHSRGMLHPLVPVDAHLMVSRVYCFVVYLQVLTLPNMLVCLWWSYVPHCNLLWNQCLQIYV